MKKYRLIKRIIAPVVALGLIVSLYPADVTYAVRSISEIEQEKSELESQIASIDSELMSVVSSIAETEAQIASTSEEIDYTQQRLMETQQAVDDQAVAMGARIQYMYENGDQNIVTVLLESGSLSDFLSRVEYLNSVYQYDRKVLDEYEATLAEVQALKAELETKMESLKASEAELATKQANLDSLLASKSGQLTNVQAELQEAKEIAARQEELRRQEAQRRAAEAAAAAAAASTSGTSSGGTTASAGAVSVPSSSGLNPTATTGVSGASIVAYANTFVGGKYVWGGSDPDIHGGMDCSGFISYVFKNMGINIGRPTSYSFRSMGQEVSMDSMQAGDVVCYAGHVGIYTGSGTIVEAQSTKAGITNYRSVYCHDIITVRRLY